MNNFFFFFVNNLAFRYLCMLKIYILYIGIYTLYKYATTLDNLASNIYNNIKRYNDNEVKFKIQINRPCTV